MEIEIKRKEDEEVIDTRLKYQYLIDGHKLPFLCPNECQPTNCFAYRFVDSATITDKDFLPTEIEDANKAFVRRSNNDKLKCLKCAISLYDTAENALKKLKYLSGKQQSNFAGKIIAIGSITESDGLASKANETGHFSFYEYVNSTIYVTFEALRYAA